MSSVTAIAQSVDELAVKLQNGRFGYIVEADIKGFFNHIDHDILLGLLSFRVDDKRFLRLIRKWLKAGILEEDGSIEYPEEGTPQGGSISPILANIYLHYAIDEWFERTVKPHCEGEAIMCRYADDFVCAFRYSRDAERFYEALPKRLERFNLQVAEDKTQCMTFSRFKPGLERRFTFLSFEFYWKLDSKDLPRVFRRTAQKKQRSTKLEITELIKTSRHMRTPLLIDKLTTKLRGHYNYFGAVGNYSSMIMIYDHAVEMLYKWLNRRSGRKSMTWEKLKRVIAYRALAKPWCTARKITKRVTW